MGDPPMAAPLEIRITVAPDDSGERSAALQNKNEALTSASQLIENWLQFNSCRGAMGGIAPPQTTRTSGRRVPITVSGASSAVASSGSVRTPVATAANSASAR